MGRLGSWLLIHSPHDFFQTPDKIRYNTSLEHLYSAHPIGIHLQKEVSTVISPQVHNMIGEKNIPTKVPRSCNEAAVQSLVIQGLSGSSPTVTLVSLGPRVWALNELFIDQASWRVRWFHNWSPQGHFTSFSRLNLFRH